MPTKIMIRGEESYESIAWLCDDVWPLPDQLAALEDWLMANQGTLEPGSYAADIGYAPRPGAAGGGGSLSVRALGIMAALGMELFLSEYPPMD